MIRGQNLPAEESLERWRWENKGQFSVELWKIQEQTLGFERIQCGILGSRACSTRCALMHNVKSSLLATNQHSNTAGTAQKRKRQSAVSLCGGHRTSKQNFRGHPQRMTPKDRNLRFYHNTFPITHFPNVHTYYICSVSFVKKSLVYNCEQKGSTQ